MDPRVKRIIPPQTAMAWIDLSHDPWPCWVQVGHDLQPGEVLELARDSDDAWRARVAYALPGAAPGDRRETWAHIDRVFVPSPREPD